MWNGRHQRPRQGDSIKYDAKKWGDIQNRKAARSMALSTARLKTDLLRTEAPVSLHFDNNSPPGRAAAYR